MELQLCPSRSCAPPLVVDKEAEEEVEVEEEVELEEEEVEIEEEEEVEEEEASSPVFVDKRVALPQLG
jgi:hypothetical protein